jgi:hypothetical protein
MAALLLQRSCAVPASDFGVSRPPDGGLSFQFRGPRLIDRPYTFSMTRFCMPCQHTTWFALGASRAIASRLTGYRLLDGTAGANQRPFNFRGSPKPTSISSL